ncbi:MULTISPECIES: hypothetical protein [Brevundimonas]|uniref:hypothetical protein n=1 Tax=Brevundimonas TaxID=41275 RepID=UPI0011D2A88B|nr:MULTISPECIES: hypothetical protein [Brevundimonas]
MRDDGHHQISQWRSLRGRGSRHRFDCVNEPSEIDEVEALRRGHSRIRQDKSLKPHGPVLHHFVQFVSRTSEVGRRKSVLDLVLEPLEAVTSLAADGFNVQASILRIQTDIVRHLHVYVSPYLSNS